MFVTVFAVVSTRCNPLPGAIPLASIQRELGITTRSSGFCTPQMKLSPPDGEQLFDCAVTSDSDARTVTHASMANTRVCLIRGSSTGDYSQNRGWRAGLVLL